jgi:hypothetical protein
MEVKVVLEREKETKNTIRFIEPEGDEPMVIGTLYVQKFALRRMGNPDRIEVTIRPA